MRITIATALIALAALAPGAAQATDTTGKITVTANVNPVCLVGNAAVDFGKVGNGQVDVAPTIDVTCSAGAAYTIAIDNGEGTGATTANRLMTAVDANNVKHTLAYTIFLDGGRTKPWGSSAGTDTFAGTGSGVKQYVPLYARLFANTTAVNGLAYADNLTVTLSY